MGGGRWLGVVVAMCVAGCGSTAAAPTASPVSHGTPQPATLAALTPYFGSYSMDDGDLVVVARLGWFFDSRDSAYRTIYMSDGARRFTIGERFAVPLPRYADLEFGAGSIRIVTLGASRSGRRIDYRQTDVTIPAAGAMLAATITELVTGGAHPGIVIVHGAEPGQRLFYDIWVGLYAHMGFAVLTYDKRGIGSSTGDYPGEFPTEAALTVYADDASAAREFLARWPGVDPARVGFHGGSQGGWTVPLAMQRHRGSAFAVLVSAPATTVDQTDLWAGFSGGGATQPTEPVDQMLAEVRDTHSGYDPVPALRALTAAALWLLGVNDRTVPTAVCVEILQSLGKPNFTIKLLPTGHVLLVNPTGLLADDARSSGLAPEMVPTLETWIAGVTAR